MKYLSWRSALFVFMCMGAVPAGALDTPTPILGHCAFVSLNGLLCATYLNKGGIGGTWGLAERVIMDNTGPSNYFCSRGILTMTRRDLPGPFPGEKRCARLDAASPLTIFSPRGKKAFIISCCAELGTLGKKASPCGQDDKGKWTDITPKGNHTVQVYQCQ